ncbi:serine hydrolase domain-containing protein [Carboxylicivirga linearis]|uniref:Serine hydrolase n=1 Tax=Carboxylicivirga linearis TaxID=1628157 RepID=A0ABS5JRU2_9BACT|nr:serine hydrolase [Carboxylicivirga linearis]MBS2097615.1 serine hydrolase [Carboxylicivirga linearis]
MTKYLLFVLLLAVCRSVFASPELDSIGNNYAEKLASLFVVPSSTQQSEYDYPPGFLIASDDEKESNKNSELVVDLRYGKKHDLAYSFPSNTLLKSITSQGFIDSLKLSALLFETLKGANGILMQNGKGNDVLSVWSDSLLHIKDYQVVDFPDDIKKTLPYKHFQTERIVPGGLTYWEKDLYGELSFLNWHGEVSLQLSFEDLLEKGFLFYSENFARDHASLVRAYEYNLLLRESQLLDSYKVDTLGLKQKLDKIPSLKVAQEQTALRLAAYRKSIAIYQKKKIFPVTDVEQTIVSVNDYRTNENDDFVNRLGFYLPNVKNAIDSVDGFNMYIVLCDSQEKLIAITEEIRKNQSLKNVNKVLVAKGQDAPFFNSSLLKAFDAIVVAEDEQDITWDMIAQAMMSGFGITGDNPKAYHLYDYGFENLSLTKLRLAFSLPEAIGMSSDTLHEVNDIISKAIKDKATPGAQILIARKGEIVWQKAYGYHTYSKRIKTQNNDLYDIASVTKLCATLPVLMKLYEENRIDINDSLIHYLPGIDTTDKRDITIKDLLLHQSGLRSFIPFHTNAIDEESLNGRSLHSGRYSSTYNIKLDNWYYQNRNAKYRKDVFQNHKNSVFAIRVSKGLFMNSSYLDTMKAAAYGSKLREKKDYRYSDLGYHFLHLVLDEKLHQSIDEYYYTNFTQKLGADKLLYKPLDRYDESVIVPTENDKSFRKELLHGYVHDQGAAMIGGVATNAGIFANAGDLAKISQMFLNKGRYGGIKFFDAQTIDYFTSRHDSINRRGLGVDKPELDPEKQSPASLLVSPSSYGHTGFSGTMVWIDPDYDLIYIFLSNRIHPHSYNKKLIESNVRTNIQDVLYHSIIDR